MQAKYKPWRQHAYKLYTEQTSKNKCPLKKMRKTNSTGAVTGPQARLI